MVTNTSSEWNPKGKSSFSWECQSHLQFCASCCQNLTWQFWYGSFYKVGTCFVRYRLGPAVMPKLNETHWIYFLSLDTLWQMDFLSTILLPIIDTSIGSFHLISDLTWKARQLLFLIWKWIGNWSKSGGIYLMHAKYFCKLREALNSFMVNIFCQIYSLPKEYQKGLKQCCPLNIK